MCCGREFMRNERDVANRIYEYVRTDGRVCMNDDTGKNRTYMYRLYVVWRKYMKYFMHTSDRVGGKDVEVRHIDDEQNDKNYCVQTHQRVRESVRM